MHKFLSHILHFIQYYICILHNTRIHFLNYSLSRESQLREKEKERAREKVSEQVRGERKDDMLHRLILHVCDCIIIIKMVAIPLIN